VLCKATGYRHARLVAELQTLTPTQPWPCLVPELVDQPKNGGVRLDIRRFLFPPAAQGEGSVCETLVSSVCHTGSYLSVCSHK
jgi:hypothetical protein